MSEKLPALNHRSNYRTTVVQSTVEVRKNLREALKKARYSAGSTLVTDHENPAAMIVPVRGGELITKAYQVGTIPGGVLTESLSEVSDQLQSKGQEKPVSLIILIERILESVEGKLSSIK